jgi:HKD family nuclease
MTNARDQPTVGREIAAEIDSANSIDLVLAFIRWTGVRDLLPALRRHTEAHKPLRVITTTYTGSTEPRALQVLVDVGAEVKVSYDTASTRLHAKAWCFRRATGFSTVYIGSSNLTFSAQVTGREWNVRASERQNPDLIEAFDRVFETYWADPHFEDFDAAQFAEATARQVDDSIATPFTIEPYPFQRQILEQLEVERRRGRHHNLVVAATGTGKTVVAALDYRQLRRRLDRARLLFVAHRKEILEKSRTTFRHVLQDGSFGELWVGGEKPRRWEHVFASIQSLSAGDLQALDPEQFDVVIVDEFHHAAATTYTTLLDHLRPVHLLGLTATPERTDTLDILRWLDGRMAVELRLWDALEQDLLSPGRASCSSQVICMGRSERCST